MPDLRLFAPLGLGGVDMASNTLSCGILSICPRLRSCTLFRASCILSGGMGRGTYASFWMHMAGATAISGRGSSMTVIPFLVQSRNSLIFMLPPNISRRSRAGAQRTDPGWVILSARAFFANRTIKPSLIVQLVVVLL